MGIISLEKSNHLYWLGRYSERAFTTIRIFMDAYDTMLDQDPNAYKHICEKLHIPDVYGSKEVFIVNYLFDETDPNSIYQKNIAVIMRLIFHFFNERLGSCNSLKL